MDDIGNNIEENDTSVVSEQKMMNFMDQLKENSPQQTTRDESPVDRNTQHNVGMNLQVEKDVNYWDITDLPTMYRLYPTGTQLTARPLKVLDVKKLTSINDENGDTIVNDILRKCVRGIDVSEIYSADKMYLLLWLRANSFRDNNYIVGYQCSVCEQESSYHFTIDKVNVDYLSDTYVPDTITSLSNGDDITFKFLQIKDEMAISSFHTRYGNIFANSGEDIDDELLAISYMIKTINGNPLDDVKRYTYLLNMSPEDFSKITTTLNIDNVGVKSYMNVECEKCGGESHVGITFLPDFFLPKLRTK